MPYRMTSRVLSENVVAKIKDTAFERSLKNGDIAKLAGGELTASRTLSY